MDYRLLELHFSQLSLAWQKSMNNRYADSKKKDYHTKLGELYVQLEKEPFSKLGPLEIKEISEVVDFFFKSLQFLDDSTLNYIPFEIVKCLEYALADWTDPKEQYIIVTSLSGDSEDFYFETLAKGEDIYRIIDRLYKIKFKFRLIQISLPEHLYRDYLANVVLYHELGHFVDRRYNVTKALYLDLCDSYFNRKLNAAQKAEIRRLFPYLDSSTVKSNYKSGKDIWILSSHLEEYLADLFAAQYVKDCTGKYLEYISNGSTKFSNTHPSTRNRIRLVSEFIGRKKTFFIDKMKKAVELSTSRKLRLRYRKLDASDILMLVPVQIDMQDQLPSLFQYGWSIWLKDPKFEKRNNMDFQLKPEEKYEIINNLIEKSIGNFIVSKTWEQVRNVSAKKTDK